MILQPSSEVIRSRKLSRIVEFCIVILAAIFAVLGVITGHYAALIFALYPLRLIIVRFLYGRGSVSAIMSGPNEWHSHIPKTVAALFLCLLIAGLVMLAVWSG